MLSFHSSLPCSGVDDLSARCAALVGRVGLASGSAVPVGSADLLPFSPSFGHIYDSHTGEDGLADKGWISGRIQKEGFGIWVIITHTQADSLISTSWKSIYEARDNQLSQLSSFIKKIFRTTRDGPMTWFWLWAT